MARKKKRGKAKRPAKATEDAAVEPSGGPAPETGAGAKKKKGGQGATSKKKKKKKGASKRAAKPQPAAEEMPEPGVEKVLEAREASASSPDDPEPEPPSIDLDAELDGDEEDHDVAGLLAAMEGLGPDPTTPSEPEVTTLVLDEPEGAPVEALGSVPSEEGEDDPKTATVGEVGRRVDPTESDASPAEAGESGRRARVAGDRTEVSSPEVRDRLLAEALAHAEHREARYRVPYPDPRGIGRWKGLGAGLVLLLAGIAAVAPPGWVRPEPPASLTPAARLQGIRASLLLQAEEIEAYRVRTQRLPATLDEVGAPLAGMRYVRSGSRAFQLIAYERDGTPVVYDSSAPSPAFATVPRTWAARPTS